MKDHVYIGILKLTLQAKYILQMYVRTFIYALNNKYNKENIYFYQADISLLLHVFFHNETPLMIFWML